MSQGFSWREKTPFANGQTIKQKKRKNTLAAWNSCAKVESVATSWLWLSGVSLQWLNRVRCYFRVK